MADGAAFSLVVAGAGLGGGNVLMADATAFAISGGGASFGQTHGIAVPLRPGFSKFGRTYQAAAFLNAPHVPLTFGFIVVDAGQYLAAVSDATLIRLAENLTSDAVAYAVGGGAVTLSIIRKITAVAVAFAESGGSIGLVFGYAMAAETGAFSESGGAAGLLRGLVVSNSGVGYALDGQPSGLVYSGTAAVMSADRGTFGAAFGQATFLTDVILSAELGAFVASGDVSNLLHSAKIVAIGSSTYVAGGATAYALLKHMGAGSATLLVSGSDVQLSYQSETDIGPKPGLGQGSIMRSIHSVGRGRTFTKSTRKRSIINDKDR